MRVLCIQRDKERFGYGVNIVIYGLKKLLGEENVICWVEMDSLFKENVKDNHYPCRYLFNKQNTSYNKIISELNNKDFDIVIVFHEIYDDALLKVIKQNNIPVFISSEEDFGLTNNYIRAIKYFNPKLCFIREYSKFKKYDKMIKPMTFSYMDHLFSYDNIDITNKSLDVFWSGKIYGYRKPILDNILKDKIIKSLIENSTDYKYFKLNDYKTRLNNSKIGISLRGNGYDSVRYYETPANMCALFTEDVGSKIVIDNEFKDGEHCIFIDSNNAVDKIKYYLNNEKELKDITINGYNHCKKYHSSTYRAQTMINHIKENLY